MKQVPDVNLSKYNRGQVDGRGRFRKFVNFFWEIVCTKTPTPPKPVPNAFKKYFFVVSTITCWCRICTQCRPKAIVLKRYRRRSSSTLESRFYLLFVHSSAVIYMYTKVASSKFRGRGRVKGVTCKNKVVG